MRSAAALALLALLAANGVGVFVHEDDGCAVEVHCRACVFALHAADGVAPAASPLAFAGVASEVPQAPEREPATGAPSVLASRGPPAA